MSKLTDKQERWVEEYLVDLNAAAAARRAGYSERTARWMGHRNLHAPHVAAEVQAAMAARSERTGITADRVLEELARIAFADIRQLVRWTDDGVRFVPSQLLTEEQAAVVSQVKAKTRTRTKQDGTEFSTTDLELKTHDKLEALRKLGDHLGLWKSLELKVDVLHWLAQLPPQRLREIQEMDDDEVLALLPQASESS